MPLSISRLTRPFQAMPAFIRQALSQAGVHAAYKDRPPYQRNDYISWIVRAKRPETQQKRLDQMLTELKRGGVYMNMRWALSR